VGQIAGYINGEAGSLKDEAIQGRVEMLLTATDRGRDFVIYPPAG
jgi:hypothetical protein